MKPNTDVKMLSPSTKARAPTVARSKDLHGSVNSPVPTPVDDRSKL
jgi:hypothetical protein